jgi:hypothetical protein
MLLLSYVCYAFGRAIHPKNFRMNNGSFKDEQRFFDDDDDDDDVDDYTKLETFLTLSS